MTNQSNTCKFVLVNLDIVRSLINDTMV